MPRLVLERRPGESIMIGDDVEVTIVRGGQSVEVLVEAPANINVDRREVYEAKKDQRAAS